MLTFNAVSSDHENAWRQRLGTAMPAWRIFTGQRPLQLCPIFMQKPEFTVSRLKSRKVQPLCQLMDGSEAMPVCTYHLACPAFIVREQEISPGSVTCWGGRWKKAYLFHCQAVHVLEAVLLLVLSVKMYILLVVLQQRSNPRARWWDTKRMSHCFNPLLLEGSIALYK